VERARALVRKTRQRLVFKRLGVLLAAMAVPAMAAPSADRTEPQVIRFVLPETIPYDAAGIAEAPSTAAAQGTFTTDFAPDFATPLAPLDRVGPAARPFAAFLGMDDRLRAQQCLAMAVYYEAASESLAGQQAVAQVVMNRVRHPAWPDSVCGVVFQGSERVTGCQFSFTCDGSLNRRPSAAAMARARSVARAALGGFVYAPVGLATHYHTTQVYPYWAPSLHPVTTIGLHRFYRWTGANGRPAAFTASYVGGEALPAFNLGNAGNPARLAAAAVYETGTPALARSLAAPVQAMAATTPDSPAPAAYPAEAASRSAILPQSGAVLEQHARSGQWLRQP
jgi:spore germination cell wall hydrolase CwlJ-like protein